MKGETATETPICAVFVLQVVTSEASSKQYWQLNREDLNNNYRQILSPEHSHQAPVGDQDLFFFFSA